LATGIWIDLEDPLKQGTVGLRSYNIRRVQFDLCRVLHTHPQSKGLVLVIRPNAGLRRFTATASDAVEAIFSRKWKGIHEGNEDKVIVEHWSKCLSIGNFTPAFPAAWSRLMQVTRGQFPSSPMVSARLYSCTSTCFVGLHQLAVPSLFASRMCSGQAHDIAIPSKPAPTVFRQSTDTSLGRREMGETSGWRWGWAGSNPPFSPKLTENATSKGPALRVVDP
jgi:hypothetical protein